MEATMSILTATASPKATAKAKETRDAWTFALVCIVICLSNVVLVFESAAFARAVELIGLS
jgi:hypothetical protein